MSDPESKKKQQKKGKHDPKEQRKPRKQQGQGAGEKKSEKRTEEAKDHKIPVAAPEKQLFKELEPEFYEALERETDKILKITEEANAKYRKKEIISNWAKYEVPIESYDDVEEQKNLGADYEKLIQAPQSLGGHFQFKHEKSWDVTTGPSLYDKYFDINSNDLATALCTIPFYERNGIDKSIFSEADILSMDQSTSRYKHKYYKIATAESEIQDKLINSLRDLNKTDEAQDEGKSESEVDRNDENEINFDESILNKAEAPKEINEVEIVFKRNQDEVNEPMKDKQQNEAINDIDDIIIETNSLNIDEKPEVKTPVPETKVVTKASPAPTEPTKDSVIETPEDLEKWLDDFLEE